VERTNDLYFRRCPRRDGDTYIESQLKLRKTDQDDFRKNRHFYPLLVQFGVEALSEADAEEIQTRLSELSDE
jgi:hypothetical protein